MPSPLIAVLFLFLLTAVALPLLKTLGRTWAFSRAELIARVRHDAGRRGRSYHWLHRQLSIGHHRGRGTTPRPENAWQELFVEYIHPWLAPADTEAVRLFSTKGCPKVVPSRGPLGAARYSLGHASSSPSTGSSFASACCSEASGSPTSASSFPLTPACRSPCSKTRTRESLFGRLFKNRLLWLGFAVPFLIQSWNSLNYYHDAFQPIALTGSPDPAARQRRPALADQSADLGSGPT